MDKLEIRTTTLNDLAWIREVLVRHWGSVTVVSRGRIYHADRLPGFLVHDQRENVGLATYSINDTECELVTLNSLREGRGLGSALLDAVKLTARKTGCTHLRVITTNDNLKALRFYQRRGFALIALHRNAIEAARKLKPEIPFVGMDEIPIRDELELEMFL